MTNTAVMSAEEAIVALVNDPGVRADPYPAYESVRAAGPAFQSSLGFWFVSSYAENARLMRHPDLVRQHGGSWELRGEMTGGTGRPWFEQQGQFMLFLDPPDHTRIRGLVSRAFTPRYLQRLRPQIDERVHELVEAFAEEKGGDLIDRLALPLPMMVICDMLGVPAKDRESFRNWTVALAATLEPFPSEEVQDRADAAIVAFIDYFKELVRDRRKNPSSDLLSALIEAEQAGERLNEHELILTTVLLLAAGFETTTNLIGNGALALLCNRDQWTRLAEDPSRSPQAVEELLRYDSPVQLATPRVARTSIDVEGGTLEEGDVMIPMVGAGNRDPKRFRNPNELDVGRDDVVPLSFGGGPHFCLGAGLARIEGAALFGHLPRRLPSLELEDQEPRWRPTMNIRGLETLVVKV